MTKNKWNCHGHVLRSIPLHSQLKYNRIENVYKLKEQLGTVLFSMHLCISNTHTKNWYFLLLLLA